MQHVIDGVCRALSVLAPLQDGHCPVQLDIQRQVKCRRDNSRFLKSQVYTVPLKNISLPPFVFPVLKKKVLWSLSEAAQPPPLRPPALTAFQLPLFCAFTYCCSSVNNILRFSLSAFLSSFTDSVNSGTLSEREYLSSSGNIVNEF
ncbi:hypothetical protein ILYODFUR_032790 [Ilyodon furcidens]|uniref:Uncharacterized protein n=1 Tax=Ilyodon furcidens TaxID=33524 RepID=A0ABV0TPW5_9TELE